MLVPLVSPTTIIHFLTLRTVCVPMHEVCYMDSLEWLHGRVRASQKLHSRTIESDDTFQCWIYIEPKQFPKQITYAHCQIAKSDTLTLTWLQVEWPKMWYRAMCIKFRLNEKKQKKWTCSRARGQSNLNRLPLARITAIWVLSFDATSVHV